MNTVFTHQTIHILLPHSPGDLVASRIVLSAFVETHTVIVYIKTNLVSLIEDLPIQIHPYQVPKDIKDSDPEFITILNTLLIDSNALCLDLIGRLTTFEWAESRLGPTLGHQIYNKKCPYIHPAPWHIHEENQQDNTHFSIRQLRVHPHYPNVCSWPLPLFMQSMYHPVSNSNPTKVALCPGCGVGNTIKRMTPQFWIALSNSLRSMNFQLSWFLGPDENELRYLAKENDIIIDGGWEEVLNEHASCRYGFTNDTCHLHIRAHLSVDTLAYFRLDWIEHWGDYPSQIQCISPPISLHSDSALQTGLDWLIIQSAQYN